MSRGYNNTHFDKIFIFCGRNHISSLKILKSLYDTSGMISAAYISSILCLFDNLLLLPLLMTPYENLKMTIKSKIYALRNDITSSIKGFPSLGPKSHGSFFPGPVFLLYSSFYSLAIILRAKTWFICFIKILYDFIQTPIQILYCQ